MPPRSTRPKGKARDAEPSGADSPPDAKHYAIMGSLLLGPALLVVIVAVAISGGKKPAKVYEEDPAVEAKKNELEELTARQKQERLDAQTIDRLMQESSNLLEQAKFERRRFYQKEEQGAKTRAFKEAVRILKSAQEKLDEAYALDKRGVKELEIDKLRQAVNQDLHNIMKDKPVYVE